MSLSCPDVRVRFAAYAAEQLSSGERRDLREHLASCGACRDEAAAADPTLVFAGSRPAGEVPAGEAARILEGVLAAVAVRRAERLLAGEPVLRRRGRRAGAVAAAAAVALLTLALPGGLSRPSAASRAAARAVTPGLAKTATPAGAFAFANTSVDGSADRLTDKAAGGARVYEIAPGAGPDEPRVVWIVDGSLDI